MINSDFSTMNDLSQRKIEGKVELYGSTLQDIFLASDKLQEITVTRVGEKGKFFGFGICQKAVIKIIDTDNNLAFINNEILRTSFRANDSNAPYLRVCPSFYIKDIKRDEKTNVFTLTAYDALDNAAAHVFSELSMEPPYTIQAVVEQTMSLLGLNGYVVPTGFELEYAEGANFGGDETLRSVLNSVADATQTIYYVDKNDYLVFKRLDRDGDPVLSIPKKDYFELTTGMPVTISKIIKVTELGDNVDAGDDSGVCQYIRDNPFLDTRTDLGTLLPESLDRITGLTITPHNIKWRGNFLTEICDKISLEAKDGSFVTTYILDDSFAYKGGFSQVGSWEYDPDSARTVASNPSNLGEKLNDTFAKVDKVNKQIDLVTNEVSANTSNIAAIQLNTDNITASVSRIESDTSEIIGDINDALLELSNRVESTMTAESVRITIQEAISNGVDKVVTETGFTFDDNGLTIAKSDSELSTNINEDGLSIFKYNEEVLTADNTGVTQINATIKQYLIVGGSRFEAYGPDRTGCFWIGG